MSKDPPIPVHVHGLRNRAAAFEGGSAGMFVGGMVGPSYASTTPSVLLTVEGVDKATGKHVDIEIAVSVDHVDRLVELLQGRKQGWS